MGEEHIETKPDMMHAPSYKLLVTTPMAAITISGKDSGEWSGLLASIAPIYAAAADGTTGEISEALATAASVLEGGDASIRPYFLDESLDFARMMEISATGADVWMCKLSDGEINKGDLIRLFKAIQQGLVEVVGELRAGNDMIDQIIQIQDKVVDHIVSLN